MQFLQFSTPEEFFLNSRMPLHCNRALADLGPSWNDLIKDNKVNIYIDLNLTF